MTFLIRCLSGYRMRLGGQGRNNQSGKEKRAIGRNRGRHQKLRYQVLSVRQKCFETRLNHILHHQFSVCEAETGSIVQACLDYLRLAHPGRRGPLDVCLPVPQGRVLRWKVAPDKVPCSSVILSPLADEDIDICMEQGTRAMQTARALRLIEQADTAACTMPLGLLASLVHQTSRTLTSRLKAFWNQHFYLPVLGIPLSGAGSLTRLAMVLSAYVHNRATNRCAATWLSPLPLTDDCCAQPSWWSRAMPPEPAHRIWPPCMDLAPEGWTAPLR